MSVEMGFYWSGITIGKYLNDWKEIEWNGEWKKNGTHDATQQNNRNSYCDGKQQ